MELTIVAELDSDVLDKDDLMNYLSQSLLSRIDDEVKAKRKSISDLSLSFESVNKETVKNKKEMDNLILDLSKEKQVGRVLSVISDLKKEGKITGKNIPTVLNVLRTIRELDFRKLKDLEQKLSLYLPDRNRE